MGYKALMNEKHQYPGHDRGNGGNDHDRQRKPPMLKECLPTDTLFSTLHKRLSSAPSKRRLFLNFYPGRRPLRIACPGLASSGPSVRRD